MVDEEYKIESPEYRRRQSLQLYDAIDYSDIKAPMLLDWVDTQYTTSIIGSEVSLNYKQINSANRVTHAHKQSLERITIDTKLGYQYEEGLKTYSDLVNVEVKSARKASDTTMTLLLDKMTIISTSTSKCCIGIPYLYPDLTANNFKVIHRKIAAING